jgi:hypothetical protein
LKIEEGSHRSKNVKKTLETGKCKEMDLPPESNTTLLDILILVH